MNKTFISSIALAGALGLGLSTAFADDNQTVLQGKAAASADSSQASGDKLRQAGKNANEKLDKSGERQKDQLEKRGARANDRLDKRADVADSNGHPARADRLDAKGDKIQDRLDNRGDRAADRADRAGDRVEDGMDRTADRLENAKPNQ